MLTHPETVRRPRPSFMLLAALDDVGEGQENYEQLWTKPWDYTICWGG
jgi:hypothetical protein